MIAAMRVECRSKALVSPVTFREKGLPIVEIVIVAS
jgi:hypothetical protein